MAQAEETDYADLELLYNEFMKPALRQALGEFRGGPADAPGGPGLDVGCGPAGVAPLLAELSGDAPVIGIDLSRPHLARAAEAVKRRGLGGRVRLAAADLRDQLPFVDDAFAWAWAADVLWPDIVAKPIRVVAELARVVRPGGRIGVFFGNWPRAVFLPGYSHIEHVLSDAAEQQCFRRRLAPGAHHENAVGWLRAAGCSDLAVSSFLVQHRQPLTEPVRRYIQAVIFTEYRQPLVGARARRLGLSEADWRTWLRLSDPNSPTNLLRHEDYYCLLIGELMVGAVPAPAAVARPRRLSTTRRRTTPVSR
jgi:SAM-dependent methyltransferase